MPLLNYTTEIEAEKTVAEIEKALSLAGAQAIMKEYDAALSQPVSLSFKIGTQYGVMAFNLPARIDSAVKILNRQAAARKIPQRFSNNREQAIRVSWRIVREWVLAQLALIELEQADATELFLPFAQGKDGRTLYERIGELAETGMLMLK